MELRQPPVGWRIVLWKSHDLTTIPAMSQWESKRWPLSRPMAGSVSSKPTICCFWFGTRKKSNCHFTSACHLKCPNWSTADLPRWMDRRQITALRNVWHMYTCRTRSCRASHEEIRGAFWGVRFWSMCVMARFRSLFVKQSLLWHLHLTLSITFCDFMAFTATTQHATYMTMLLI